MINTILLILNIIVWSFSLNYFLMRSLPKNTFLLNNIISFFVSLTGISTIYLICLVLSATVGFYLIIISVISIISLIFIKDTSKYMESIFSNIKSFFYRRESVIMLASILLMSLVFSLHSARWVGWDSWAILNMHAKSLTFSNNWTNLFTSHIEWTHPDYPLMLSSYIAIFWKLLGNFTPIVPSILAYIVFAAVPLSIYSSLKSKNLELLGLILFLILALDSKFIYRAASQYSDTLLSLYILLTIIFFNKLRT